MWDEITRSTLVEGNNAEIFRLWADFENFPRFARHIRSVTIISPHSSHWVMKGPFGKDIEWDARITALEPNSRIAWKTTEGDVEVNGEVTFEPVGDEQTCVTVRLQYHVTAGALGEALARLLANPERALEDDLERFKEFAEEGVFAVSA